MIDGGVILRGGESPDEFRCFCHCSKYAGCSPANLQIFRLCIVQKKLGPSLLGLEEFQKRRRAEIAFRPNQQSVKMRLHLKPIPDGIQNVVCDPDECSERSDIGNITGNRAKLLHDLIDRQVRPSGLEVLIQVPSAAFNFEVDLAMRKAVAHSQEPIKIRRVWVCLWRSFDMFDAALKFQPPNLIQRIQMFAP